MEHPPPTKETYPLLLRKDGEWIRIGTAEEKGDCIVVTVDDEYKYKYLVPQPENGLSIYTPDKKEVIDVEVQTIQLRGTID